LRIFFTYFAGKGFPAKNEAFNAKAAKNGREGRKERKRKTQEDRSGDEIQT